MTSVANDKSDVVLVGEFQGLGNMDGRRDIDCVFDKVAKGAWLGNGVVWVACSIGKEGGHERR
jgi:hypothetical protein